MERRAALAAVLAALGLLLAAPLRVASAPSPAPSSECHPDPSGNGQFICNVYESDGNGHPSEISNIFTASNVPIAQFIALVENPGASPNDPRNWSDLLVIGTPSGGAANAQLFSEGCNNPNNAFDTSCYPARGNVGLQVVNETATGQGNDYTDSTAVTFGANYNIFSDCACPNDTEGGPPGIEIPDAPMAAMLPLAALISMSVLALQLRRRSR